MDVFPTPESPIITTFRNALDLAETKECVDLKEDSTVAEVLLVYEERLDSEIEIWVSMSMSKDLFRSCFCYFYWMASTDKSN